MPTYEYSCKTCGEHLEVVQSFKDKALTECPKCGGDLRKVFGNIGIVFKGSGFYRNDSRQGHSSVKPAASSPAASEALSTPPSGESSKSASTASAPEKAPAPAPVSSSATSKDKGVSSPSSAAAAS